MTLVSTPTIARNNPGFSFGSEIPASKKAWIPIESLTNESEKTHSFTIENLRTSQEGFQNLSASISFGISTPEIVSSKTCFTSTNHFSKKPSTHDYLVSSYSAAFNIPNKDASRIILELMNDHGLDGADIEDLIDCCRSKIPTNGQPSSGRLLRRFHRQLPRDVQHNPDGSVQILFKNVKSKGDRLVGEGGEKKVKIAKDLKTGEKVIVHSLVVNTMEQLQRALREFNHSKQVSGQEGLAKTLPYRITYKGKKGASKFSFMQKFYNGRDLFTAMFEGRYPSLSNKEISLIISKLLTGLETHHKTSIHRDIKFENIFLSRDPITNEVVDAVIGDFGMACSPYDRTEKALKCGTARYWSPEYCKGVQNGNLASVVTTKHDLWSLGIILYYLIGNEVPEWAGKNYLSWMQNEKHSDVLSSVAKLSDSPNWLPEPADKTSMGHLVWEMLRPDPKERIDCKTAKEKIANM